MFKYCENTTTSHPVCIDHANQVEKIADIFHAEGCKTKHFGEERAINLDEIETSKCRKEKRSKNFTMDLSIGIIRNKKECRMVLVELKFNLKNVTNLKESDILDKERSSINILGRDVNIHTQSIVVFSDNRIREAKRLVARWQSNKSKQIVAQSAKEFKEQYFD